ncbi:MAG TPA: acyltransferase [Pseudonocardiaceae bacterium]|nr:acyltransferase [Pseudonocardiaceae bacterium]
MTIVAERRDVKRLAYVDNLKTILVAWIIGGHGLLGYTAIGGWPYDEVNEVTLTPRAELILAIPLGPSALFVIGVFFFLAGLFVPAALRRRGPGRFAIERIIRLGLPWLAFALLLWPLMMWLTYLASGRHESYWWVFTHRDPFLHSGPLWFALVLMLFSLGYAGWWAIRRRPAREEPEPKIKDVRAPLRAGRLIALAAGMALATFVVRLWFPARSTQIADPHLWQWPQCAAMFGLGIAGARQSLAASVPDRLRRGCGAITIAALVLVPVLGIAAGVGNLAVDTAPFLGGWRWEAMATAVFESILVVAGSVWLLGVAQRRLNHTGPLASACARGAFAAFMLQAPVLLALAVAARPMAVPVEVKSFLVAGLGIVVSFWLGWLAVSRTPLRRIM